jgi:hypothetical protein
MKRYVFKITVEGFGEDEEEALAYAIDMPVYPISCVIVDERELTEEEKEKFK